VHAWGEMSRAVPTAWRMEIPRHAASVRADHARVPMRNADPNAPVVVDSTCSAALDA
jgi:hypothetical protein